MRFIDGVGYVDIPDEKNDWHDVPSDEMTLEQARQAVKNLRKKLAEHLEQEPKTGHWITTRTFMHDGEFYCDKCKCEAPNNEKWDYCPNCGARMESEEQA